MQTVWRLNQSPFAEGKRRALRSEKKSVSRGRSRANAVAYLFCSEPKRRRLTSQRKTQKEVVKKGFGRGKRRRE
jgi:hypothetical protein